MNTEVALAAGFTLAATLSARRGGTKVTLRALGWPGEHWCSFRRVQQDTWLHVPHRGGDEQELSPALSPVRFSCAKKKPSSIWLFFSADGAESLLFLKEKVCLPLCAKAWVPHESVVIFSLWIRGFL